MRRVQAKQMQQELAELFGATNGVTWDRYTSSDKQALKQKIEFVFPGTSEEEINQIRNNPLISQAEKNKKINVINKENEKLESVRLEILNATWAQRKWSDRNLFMSIIFVLCVPEDFDREAIGSNLLTPFLLATEYTCHPLLRIRKCRYENDSSQCCMIFVGEDGRVYQNWKDYKIKNTLPAGVLLAPYNGVYDFDHHNTVIVDAFLSPASYTSAKICQAADTGAGVLGLGAAAAFFLPVAAPILAASAVGFGVGIWSTLRSGANIYDRSAHEQSINITNSQARGAWLGIAGGLLGMGAGAAASRLGSMAAGGSEVSEVIKAGVTGISVAAIAVNCVGVGHSAVDMLTRYRDDEPISAYDVLQLGASLFMVTHSVYNYKSANAIIEDTRSQTIRDFRTGLSNRQRRMFNKVYKETLRIKGQKQGKVDIIRGLRNIPDRGKFFSDIYKVNKKLNQNNLRPSFGADGSILINNDINVDSTTLRSNLQGSSSSNDFLQNVAPIPRTHSDRFVRPNDNNLSTVVLNSRILELGRLFITRYSVLVEGDLENLLRHIYGFLRQEAADRFLELVQDLFERISVNIQQQTEIYIPFEQFLWDVFNITFTVSDGDMNETISVIPIGFLEFQVTQFYRDLFVRNVQNTQQCQFCRGYFTLVELTD